MSVLELTAKPSWQTVDFISDLHLQGSQPETFHTWQRYMQTTAADAVFILGDFFEVWVGDDVLQEHGFEQQCAQVIRQTAACVPTFFMHGNRDFLIGGEMMTACNTALLPDPTVLSFNHKRWLLSHGDELCTGDTAYMTFRNQVRSSDWQRVFLTKPLAERQAIAQSLRQQSRAQHEVRKKSGADDVDVDASAARQLLQQANAKTLIHGHTHKPAEHDLGDGLQRVVLSDWDADTTPQRAQILRLSASGLERVNLC